MIVWHVLISQDASDIPLGRLTQKHVLCRLLDLWMSAAQTVLDDKNPERTKGFKQVIVGVGGGASVPAPAAVSLLSPQQSCRFVEPPEGFHRCNAVMEKISIKPVPEGSIGYDGFQRQ